MIDSIFDFFRDFFKGISDFFKSIYIFISEFIDWYSKLIKDFWLSLYDFIIDLIPNLISLLSDLLSYIFGDLLSSVCDYCFGDWDIIINNDLSLLVLLPDSLGSSLIYILQQCGFEDAMKKLSCGIMMWVVLRIISLIRG